MAEIKFEIVGHLGVILEGSKGVTLSKEEATEVCRLLQEKLK